MSCDHEECHCQSEAGVLRHDGGRFCSDYCADARSGFEESCRCGHAGCSTADELEAVSR